MKILVTGGLGFIGSAFIRQCLKADPTIEVINFDKVTYAASPLARAEFEQESRHILITGNLADPKAISQTIKDCQPQYVVNFAAESHVDRSIANADSFVATNVLGAYNLLTSCLTYYKTLSESNKRAFRILHISTDEVYGSLGSEGKFSEVSPYNPRSPYSASKAAADHLVSAWFHTHKLPTIIAHPSNNYGPYQHPEKLIPKMILSAIAGQPLALYGDGSHIRDWLYVEDCVEGLYTILKKAAPGSRYNIGGNCEFSNKDVVMAICTILNETLPAKRDYSDLITFTKDRPGHDWRYALDTTKILKTFQWKPKNSFQNNLKQTISWYRANQNFLKI